MAIGILSTSIASALSLTTLSLAAEQESLSAIVAANLAREGVEVARTIRDSNWLAGLDWDNGLYEGAGNPDYTAVPVFEPNSGDWHFYYAPDNLASEKTRVFRHESESSNATRGLYRQFPALSGAMIDTGFRRLVELHPVCVDTLGIFSVIESGKCSVDKAGIRVRVTVTWNVAGRDHQLVVEEGLYDWR